MAALGALRRPSVRLVEVCSKRPEQTFGPDVIDLKIAAYA
jgi:hypothetical protein